MGSLSEKIANAELRRSAEAASEKRESVIVELDLPARQIVFEGRPGDPLGAVRAKAVAPETPDEVRRRESRTRDLAALLKSLVGTEPRHLAGARAFVLDLTGAQIAKLVESDLVKAISPNRKLR